MSLLTPLLRRCARSLLPFARTTAQEALAKKLAAINFLDRTDSSFPGSDDTRNLSGTSKRPNSADRTGDSRTTYSQRQPQGRKRGGDGAKSGSSSSSSSSPPDSSFSRPGAGIGDLLRFGDDEGERDGDDEDALAELGDAAKAVGDVALLALQETAAFVTGTAEGLFPEAFPDFKEDENSSANGRGSRRKPRSVRREAGEGGGRAGESLKTRRARRTRAVRERAGGVRRALAGFAQGSANRAGLAVARSAANGALRGAEAAADWAGGGALAREYVLLFVAAFCLVFKRGVGASFALLVVIKASRVTLQRLVSETWAGERSWGADSKGGGAPQPQPAGATAGPSSAGVSAPRSGRRSASAASSPRRRNEAKDTGEKRRRRTTTTTTIPKRNEGKAGRKKNAGSGAKKPARSNKGGKGKRRKPLWDESDDEFDKGCVLM